MWHNQAAIRPTGPTEAAGARMAEGSNTQHTSASRNVLEMSQPLEGSKPFFNFFVVQDSQSVKTKGFYGK
jgi:hypothetical protein